MEVKTRSGRPMKHSDTVDLGRKAKPLMTPKTPKGQQGHAGWLYKKVCKIRSK